MSVVNYWFGMEHEMALYQINEGKEGLAPAETSAGLGGVAASVRSFSETWIACGMLPKPLEEEETHKLSPKVGRKIIHLSQ